MRQTTQKLLCRFLLLAVSFSCSMGLFLAAYRWDNKYTLRTPQPMGGLLFFNPDTDPVTHLINGWQFYRGRLLTPDDFQGEPPLPDGYVSIGQYTGMETGRNDLPPHGSITYSMTLILPDTPVSCSLELPEIYSAYRLYVGDRLLASQGDPGAEHGQPRIHSGLVTFEAAKTARILLAVSDWSWLYSGLVYPPAFGAPAAVATLLDQKFAWSLSVTVLALLLGVAQLILSAILKSRRALYSALICMAFAVSVCSQPLHRLLTTGVVPFYNLELFCRYAVYGLAVLLVRHLYGRRTRVQTAISAAAVLFPFVALSVSLSAPVLPLFGMLLFSRAAELYKIFCACRILVTALMAGSKETLEAGPLILLAGACVFASSLIADRLLPSFEPIRFGWYSETAGFIFALLLSFLIFRDSARIYQERLALAQEKELLQNQIRLQKNHYADLAGQMQDIRTVRHDIRHHFNQLGLLLKGGDYEGATAYLNRVAKVSLDTVPLTFCENYMADVLLRFYYAKAQKSAVPFEIRAELPAQTGLPDEDLSVILGNVLENALEASLLLPEEKRFLSLSATLHSDNLVIESSNAFCGELEEHSGKYRSSKENGRYGIGISSIRSVAERYDGNVWIDTEERDGEAVFHIRILLITAV